MNNLQLCQRLRQECGIPGTGPATVVSQTGESRRLVDWIAQAWNDIQLMEPNWKWMRREFTVNTVASDDLYSYGDCTDTTDSAPITRFSRWYAPCDDTPFLLYLTSAGVGTQRRMTYWEWNDFKQIYKIATQNPGFPGVVSIDPNDKIRLGPKPNDIYTLSGDYQMSPQTLAVDADTPEMPAQFHMTIVFEAMKKYAAFAGAPEVYERAKLEGGPLMLALAANQLPPVHFGGSIV
jgi:hypothetical protein